MSQPPKKDDRTFVVSECPQSDCNPPTCTCQGLDTGCSFRSDGPLIIEIPIDRFLGPTNADGTLRDAAQLVAAGYLAPYATLTIPALDVDDDSTPPAPGDKPERDVVFFNGVNVHHYPPNSAFLRGDDNVWGMNTYRIPIEMVRFPSARGALPNPQTGAPGSRPDRALNDVKIDIDTGNIGREELWCTGVDWVSLSIQAMSPIILIHGNNSDGGFFVRQGFMGHLVSKRLLADNSIKLPTGKRSTNASLLNQKIPPIVTSFGVDSVHLVMHSKGGLDTREYLVLFQHRHDNEFKVLSYTSLSTPHNGSALADLVLENTVYSTITGLIDYAELPSVLDALASLVPASDDLNDLSTSTCAAFNDLNIPRLPRNVVYNAVGGDADLNGNGEIDDGEYGDVLVEVNALSELYDTPVLGSLAATYLVDSLYQYLRFEYLMPISYESFLLPGSESVVVPLFVSILQVPVRNDLLVTIPSALGEGSMSPLFTNTCQFVQNGDCGAAATQGRNHANIADEGVAKSVISWLSAIETSKGDLRPTTANSPGNTFQKSHRTHQAAGPGLEDDAIRLQANQSEVSRLGPDLLSGSVGFPVDECTSINVVVTATISDLTTSITGPASQSITPANVETFGGIFTTIDSSASDSPFAGLFAQPGFHHHYRFPSLGTGTYTVNFSAPSDLAKDAAVITEVSIDSELVAALFTTQSSVAVGQQAVLVAAVFQGASPWLGPPITIIVKPPTSAMFDMLLRDDGADVDMTAADGMFSGRFLAAEEGDYAAIASITGTNSHGTPFARSVGTRIKVVASKAQFTGAPFVDFAVDDNANAAFDRLLIAAPVTVGTPGSFAIDMLLGASGGDIFRATGQTSLPGGAQAITASLTAEQLREVGVDGPYTILSAHLVFLGTDGAEAADSFEDGTQLTQAYSLSQFERPAIELSGTNSFVPVDDDGDGDFDKLVVNIGLDLAFSDIYQYSARLVSNCGSEIEFINGFRQLNATGPSVDLRLEFSGQRIGTHGVDGPFHVRDLLVLSSGGSLVAVEPASTPAFTASEFDGFTDGDCDGNTLIDACEIVEGTAVDCNRNFRPDSCDIANGFDNDVNLNGLPDSCEACAAPRGTGNIMPVGPINLADYQFYQSCLGGPGTDIGTGCEVMDLNGDCRVDLRDFAVFQTIFGSGG